jgi:hypothetical protein
MSDRKDELDREAALNRARKAREWDNEHRQLLHKAYTHEGTGDFGKYYALAVARLMNFMVLWGHEDVEAALIRVERSALYGCQEPPSRAEMDLLAHVREVTDHVNAIGEAYSLERGRLMLDQPPLRFAERPEKQEDDFLSYFRLWGYENVLQGLRTALRRAAFWQQDPEVYERDQAALICVDELVDRLQLCCYNWYLDTPLEEQKEEKQRRKKAAKA